MDSVGNFRTSAKTNADVIFLGSDYVSNPNLFISVLHLSHDMWNGPFGMFTHGMVRRAITNLIFYEREKEST